MRSNSPRESDHPLRQGGQWLADTAWVDGSLARTQRLLGENEVEDADDILDISALGGLCGNPALDEPVGKVEESLGRGYAVFLQLRNVVLESVLDSNLKVVDFPKELIAEGLNDRMVGHVALLCVAQEV